MNFTLRAVVGGILAWSALVAHAGDVTAIGSTYGFNTVHVGNPVDNGPAGQFTATVAGFGVPPDGTFYTYCVELQQYAYTPTSGYSVVSGSSYFLGGVYNPVFSSPVWSYINSPARAQTIATNIGQLMSYVSDSGYVSGASGPSQSERSTGVQMAIWELIYDTESVHTLGTGSFQSYAADAWTGDANFLLTQSVNAGYANHYAVDILASANAQDYLLLRRVPEPASLALVGLALVGLGAARRRNAAT